MPNLRRARMRRATCGLLAAAALTMAATATAAPASAADFNCDASALRGTVLSAAAIEPVTANRDRPMCLDADGGVGVSLPPTLSADAVFAQTSSQGAANLRTVTATAGVDDLHVSSVQLAALNNFASVNILGVGVVDLRPALHALQARTDLLTTSAVATAGGRCLNGAPQLTGSSELTGLTVLGQQISSDTANLAVTLDPSDLTDADIALLGLLPSDTPLIRLALDTLSDITVAQVNATIGGQTTANGKLTQQAARVQVTSAGQSVTDLVIGEATVTGAAVNCAAPVLPPVSQPPVGQPPVGQPPTDQPPGGLTAEQRRQQLKLQQRKALTAAALSCTTRRLVLVDVLRRGQRVKLRGAADKRFIGTRVGIVFPATGRKVASATVRADGSFATSAALPPRSMRGTNRARYQAVKGSERSLSLKLTRRMTMTSMTSRRGRVVIAGRITRPLAKPREAITLQRRVSCTRLVTVKRFMPSAGGRFRVTAKAPKGKTSVFRLTTKVRHTTRNAKQFRTFTLPRAVNVR